MSLEKIYQLQPDESNLLFSCEINGESIEVREWQQFRWLHLSDNSVQSLIHLDAIEQVALPNIQALLATLLFCPRPKSLLNLGLGGASLERYLVANRPGLKIQSVESNELVIKIAQDYFYLPKTIDVVHDAAEKYISNCHDTFDIILCDIFAVNFAASFGDNFSARI
jgi:spermidine synthase